MDREGTLQRVETLLGPVLGHLGYELIERELVMDGGRWVLRLYVDKLGGVTVGDCERASRGVEDLLEVEGLLPEACRLEVSSPGIRRPIRRREDFEKYAGSRVRVRTRAPLEGRSNYVGILRRFEKDEIVLEIDGRERRIPYSELERARLEEDQASSSPGAKGRGAGRAGRRQHEVHRGS